MYEHTWNYGFVQDADGLQKIVQIIDSSSSETENKIQDLSSGCLSLIKKSLILPILADELENPPSNLIKLRFVHGPGILHTLNVRFMKNLIYTSIGPILVALNPFKWIDCIYDQKIMSMYHRKEKNLSDHPHVFAIAQEAFDDLYLGDSQSLIISGESGAGKTEATKQCLSYLSFIAGGDTQNKILSASPILEGWGNAKTLRNNNSSRFGKYIEIMFEKETHKIIGSSNTTYILEKSRVVFQDRGERNYHIFYQLLKCGDLTLLTQLELLEMSAEPSMVQYINQSGCISIEEVNDSAEFLEAVNSFYSLDFSEEEQLSLFTIIAGILQFGNVVFDINANRTEESIITPNSELWLARASNRFGIDIQLLKQALLYKTIKSGNNKRTSITRSSYLPSAATDNRNALAKEIYKRCFDWIVSKINLSMGRPNFISHSGKHMIGILDIFGFEIFAKNSFEQLCINLANEALQNHFNHHIFQAEMTLYSIEGIPLPSLTYNSNQDVLDLIIKRPTGLISMLDEEGMVPKGSYEGFLRKFDRQYTGHPRYKRVTPSSKNGVTHELGIVHYAGDVFYDVSLFLVKNKDTLSSDLSELFGQSALPLIRDLFEDMRSDNVITDRRGQSEAKMTVGRKFSAQLESLIVSLNSTKPRYIRCIKSNQFKKPNIFEQALVDEQLKYSGVFEAVIIMQNGYPYRLELNEFRSQYHCLLLGIKSVNCFSHTLHMHSLLFNEQCLVSYLKNGIHKNIAEECDGKWSNAQQCEYLLQSIVAIHPSSFELLNCIVGKSKVFYQSLQHSILHQMKDSVEQKNAIFLQRCSRRKICTQFYVLLKGLKNDCLAAISLGDCYQLELIEKSITNVVRRMNLVLNFIFSFKLLNISMGFRETLQKVIHLKRSLKFLFESDERPIVEKHEDMLLVVKNTKQQLFNAYYNGTVISYSWEDDTSLREYVRTVEEQQVVVSLQKRLVSGIKSRNEILLENLLFELHELLNSGVVSSGFCNIEEQQAINIINDAKKNFSTFLSDVTESLLNGGVVCETNSLFSVDSASLSHLLAKYKFDLAFESERMRIILTFCDDVRQLRQCSSDGLWTTVWAIVRDVGCWQQLVTKDKDANYMNSVAWLISNRVNHCVFSLKLQDSLNREIHSIHSAVFFFYARSVVTNILSSNRIPVLPFVAHTNNEFQFQFVDTTELSIQASDLLDSCWTDIDSEFISSEIVQFTIKSINLTKLRKAVSVSNQNDVNITLLSSAKESEQDYSAAMKCVEVFSLMKIIECTVQKDTMVSEPTFIPIFDMVLLYNLLSKVKDDFCDGILSINLFSAVSLLYCCRAGATCFNNAIGDIILQSLFHSYDWKLYSENQYKLQKRWKISILYYDLQCIVSEIKSHIAAISHMRSLRRLLKILQFSAITGDCDELLLPHFVIGEDTVDRLMSFIVQSEENKSFSILCKVLVTLRIHISSENWQAAENVVDGRSNFVGHEVWCNNELELMTSFIQNRKLYELLLRFISNSFITNNSAVESIMGDIVQSVSLGFILSVENKQLLSQVKLVYCLHSAIMTNKWEPVTLFFFGQASMSDFLNVIFDTVHRNSFKTDSAEFLIYSLCHFERLVQFHYHNIESYIDTLNVEKLTVIEILSYYIFSSNYILCTDEVNRYVNQIQQHSFDRRCQAVLLVSATFHQIHGSIEVLKFNKAKVGCIEMAIQFVTTISSSWQIKLSKLTRQLFVSCQQLLEVRRNVLNFRVENNIDTAMYGLLEVISEVDLYETLNTIPNEFPVTELKLIYDVIFDLKLTRELSRAIGYGAPSFSNGKFDASQIDFCHLVQRLSDAKVLPQVSDRMDRLFFYTELCIKLRKSLCALQWDFSIAGDTSTAERGNISVNSCLEEFEQANRFFRTVIQDIPPLCLIDEFRLVTRERDRRLMMLRFSAAFNHGCVRGRALSLVLSSVSTELLSLEIDRVIHTESVTGEKDKNVEILTCAANQLVVLRGETLKVHNLYRRDYKFKSSTNMVKNILEDSGFLCDAVSTAVDLVQKLCHHPNTISDEFYNVSTVLHGVHKITQTTAEVSLIEEEAFERFFIVNALTLLKQVDDSVQCEHLMDSFFDLIKGFDTRKPFCRSFPVQYLYDTCVVTIHYLRSRMLNIYDKFERNWSSDQNMISTPRLCGLVSNLFSGTYSIQQIVRSASKMYLHPSLIQYLSLSSEFIELQVSEIELRDIVNGDKHIFEDRSDNQAMEPISLKQMESVLRRVDKTKAFNSTTYELYTTAMLINKLRQAVFFKNYREGFDILKCVAGDQNDQLHSIISNVAAGNFYVNDLAKEEFQKLAIHICMGFWQTISIAALVEDCLSGKPVLSLTIMKNRANLHYAMYCAQLFPLKLFISDIHTLKLLCVSIFKLRGMFVFDNPSECMNLHVNLPINTFILNIVSSVVTCVESMVKSNITWAHISEMQLSNEIGILSDEVNTLTARLVTNGILIESHGRKIYNECQLCADHYRFLELACTIERALNEVEVIRFGKNGLLFYIPFFVNLQILLNEMKHDQDWRNISCWWFDLSNVAGLFLELVKSQSPINYCSSTGLVVFNPGSSDFQKVLPIIIKLLSTLTDFKKKWKVIKSRVIPHLFDFTCDHLLKSIKEHNLLISVEHIGCADRVVNVTFNGQNTLSVIPFRLTSESYLVRCGYYNNFLKRVKPATKLGMILVNTVNNLVDLRCGVALKNWNSLQELCQRLHQDDHFVVKLHLDLIRIKRNLQQLIFNIGIPINEGWSIIRENYLSIVTTTKANSFALQAVIAEALNTSSSENDIIIYDLLAAGTLLCELIIAIEGNIWVPHNDTAENMIATSFLHREVDTKVFDQSVNCIVDKMKLLSAQISSSHVKDFIGRIVKCLQNEIMVNQLCKLYDKCFEMLYVRGGPGHLIYNDDIVSNLLLLLSVYDVSAITQVCPQLLFNQRYARCLLLSIVAHQRGNLADLSFCVLQLLQLVMNNKSASLAASDRSSDFMISQLLLFVKSVDSDDKNYQAVKLLIEDCIFETMFCDFRSCLLNLTSNHVSGKYEDISTSKDRDLHVLLHLEKQFAVSGLLMNRNAYVSLLFSICKCLRMLRSGQNTSNSTLILAALQIFQKLSIAESEMECLSCSYFGGERKEISTLCTSEFQAAAENLRQFYIVLQLKSAIMNETVSVHSFPFDLLHVNVEPLKKIIQICDNEISPSTAAATTLFKVSNIIYILREEINCGNWTELKKVLKQKNIFMELFQNNFCCIKEVMDFCELECALCGEIVDIMYGIQSAQQCYKLCEKIVATLSDVQEQNNTLNIFENAVSALADIDGRFTHNDICRHFVTCNVLQFVVKSIFANDWLAVCNGLQFGFSSCFCKEQLSLFLQYSRRKFTHLALTKAIVTNTVLGDVGNVQTTLVSIHKLSGALQLAHAYNDFASDLSDLQNTAEFLKHCRKQIILNSWTIEEISLSRLYMLDCYFTSTFSHIDNSLTIDDCDVYETKSQFDGGECVESLLCIFSTLRFSSIAAIEIQLIKDETQFRTIYFQLLKHVFSPGAVGIPGIVDVSHIATRYLEEAIFWAEQNQKVVETKRCSFLLRDSKMLLYARKYRLLHDWSNLNRILHNAEVIHKTDVGGAFFSDENTIFFPVWEEIQLLKGDALFHVCLCEFAKEMSKEESVLATLIELNIDKGINNDDLDYPTEYSLELHKNRITAMEDILNFTTDASQLVSIKSEFDRLIEAELLALELRRFCFNEPRKSPQDVIHRVALAKKCDKENLRVCYVSLLIYDLSKMSNMLDFPLNLEIIQNEILTGQKYISRPVGQIQLNEINIDMMVSAYTAAIPSLEIMGSEDNHAFMRLAAVVILIRKTLQNGDLRAVMKVISDNEEILKLQSCTTATVIAAISAEICRLRLEMDNFDAIKLIEFGLKNGRCLDVFTVAKLVNAHDSSTHDKQFSICQSVDIIEKVANLRSSISSLERAVEVAGKIDVKSEVTEYYLKTAKIILNIRSCITENKWEKVRHIVSIRIADIPAAAVDEICVVREGLIYQKSLVSLLRTVDEGSISGQAYCVKIEKINYINLSIAINDCEQSKMTDQSALLIIGLAKIVKSLRKAFLDSRWSRFDLNSVHFQDDNPKLLTNDILEKLNDLQNNEALFWESRNNCFEDNVVDNSVVVTVEEAIDEFIGFEEKYYSFLENLFKDDAGSNCNGEMSWVSKIWHSINSVRSEIKLVLDVIKYNSILNTMISAMRYVPVSVSRYFQHSENVHGEKVFMRGCIIDSYCKDDGYVDDYQLSVLHEAIYSSEEYLTISGLDLNLSREVLDSSTNSIAENMEIYLLLNTIKLIFQFRKILSIGNQNGFSKMLLLVEEVKAKYLQQHLSNYHGINELQCYVSVTENFVTLKSGLSWALENNRVSGHLDDIVNNVKQFETVCLEQWIVKCVDFLCNAAELTIGLQKIVHYASSILKLRTAINEKNWTFVKDLLANIEINQHSDEDCGYIWEEFQQIHMASKFESLHNKLQSFTKNFHLHQTNFENNHFELTHFHNNCKKIFDELGHIMQFKSSLVKNHEALSQSYFRSPQFVSANTLHRLLSIICDTPRLHNIWYDKNKNDSIDKLHVAKNKDIFLLRFFGINDSDIIKSCSYDDNHFDGSLNPDASDTVFSLLITTDWSVFPSNVQMLFNCARNTLIDTYIRTDLCFYCENGQSHLDKHGNIFVSDVYLRCLSMAIADVERVRNLAHHLSVKDFKLSDTTKCWLSSAVLIQKCRVSLANNDTQKLGQILLSFGVLLEKNNEYCNYGLLLQYEKVSIELLTFVTYFKINNFESCIKSTFSIFLQINCKVGCESGFFNSSLKELYSCKKSLSRNIGEMNDYVKRLHTIIGHLTCIIDSMLLGDIMRFDQLIKETSALSYVPRLVSLIHDIQPTDAGDVVFSNIFLAARFVCLRKKNYAGAQNQFLSEGKIIENKTECNPHQLKFISERLFNAFGELLCCIENQDRQSLISCFNRLCEIQFDISDDYIRFEPLWALSLLLVIVCLRKAFDRDTQLSERCIMPSMLMEFLHSLNLQKYGVNDRLGHDIKSKPKIFQLSRLICFISADQESIDFGVNLTLETLYLKLVGNHILFEQHHSSSQIVLSFLMKSLLLCCHKSISESVKCCVNCEITKKFVVLCKM